MKPVESPSQRLTALTAPFNKGATGAPRASRPTDRA